METYLVNYLIVVLCGYYHIHFRPSLKYKHENTEQATLAFSAFLYGVIIYLIAYYINCLVEFYYFDFLQKNLVEHKDQLSWWYPFTLMNSMNKYPRIILTNIFLTLCVSNIFFDILWKNTGNRFKWQESDKQSFRLKQREKNTSQPEKIIIKDFGFSEKIKVIITLKNRKVYIGESHDYDPDEAWDKSFVSIIPSKSGYRDRQDLSFHIKQDYESIRNETRNKTRENITTKIRELLNNSIHSHKESEEIIKEIKEITKTELDKAEEKIKHLSTPIIINKNEILIVATWRDDFYSSDAFTKLRNDFTT